MNRTLALAVLVVATALEASTVLAQEKQDRAAKVRSDRKHVESLGSWIYDDLPRAVTEAKASGKPLLVVFRCIPCEACAKLDLELVERSGAIQPLLDKFVCCRIPKTNGMDLSIYQFDFDQSLAAFFLNADMTIYGRYGTRSDQTKSDDDVSIEGFAKALEGALAIHAGYPKNQASLAGKRGAPLAVKVPEDFPSVKGRFKPELDWDGKVVQSCMHCHQVGQAERVVYRSAGQPIPEKILYPYPNPKILGLVMDPKEKARVLSVTAGSPAERDGFKAGDDISILEGQPILSIADVQWVLNAAGESGSLKAEVVRGAAPVALSMTLAPGWRQKGDLSWRATSWDLRRMTTGGLVLEDLGDSDRLTAGLQKTALGLRVKSVGQFGEHATAKKAGFQQGDIIVAVDGKAERLTESDLMASLTRRTKPGDKVAVTVMRGGKKVDLTLPMQ